MTRPVPFDILAPFLEAAEGSKLRPYRDGGGVLTVGIGHTGPDVVAGHVWTQAQVYAALKTDLAHAAVELEHAVGSGPLKGLDVHQYAALLSFVFNVGADPTWTIWRVLKARKLSDVPTQMMRFIHDDGKVVDGLINRRKAEVALWDRAVQKA